MRHEAPNELHATPRRATRAASAVEVAKKLRGKFQPAGQAHADALRHEDDPAALAGHFGSAVEIGCADERAQIKTDALDILSQNIDAAGALVVTVDPTQVTKIAEDAEIGVQRIEVECEKSNDKSIGIWRHGKIVFESWCEKSGGQLNQLPTATLAVILAVLSLAGLIETWGVAQLMDSQPVAGEVSPYLRGLMFAVASVAWGVMGALGTSLAVDKRSLRRRFGFALVVAALFLWLVTAILAAHMRAVIENGGLGTADEILASLHRGIFWAFASPVALILAAASALTTGTAWKKVLDFTGRPLGAREAHEKRRWAEEQLNAAELAHKAAISMFIAERVAFVKDLVVAAWEPANDGHRLLRETGLALAQARECFAAVGRIAQSLVGEYAATFRRVRPGVDVSHVLQYGHGEFEELPDPKVIHDRVEALTRAAGAVDSEAATVETKLRTLELESLRRIEQRFASTRTGVAGGAVVRTRL